MKIVLKTTIAIGIFIAVGLMAVNGASAITLIPPSLEIGLKPGKIYSAEIKLYNETANPVQLYTEKVNFTAQGETGKPDFDFDSDQSSGIVSWMDIEEGPIIIQPGERYKVPISINTPTNADPGGHYATIFFGTNPPDEGQVRISSKVGTLILASVDGEVREQGSITEFSTKDSQTTFNRLPIEFFARIQNSGNVHLKPTGTIEISGMFGGDAEIIDFNTSKGAILPGTIRKYEVIWEKANVIENPGNVWSDFWQEYSNEKNNFGLGQYTAILNIEASTGGAVTDTAEMSFWIIPWRMLMVWGVTAVIVVILVIAVIKKYNKWIIKKSTNK